MGEFLIHSYIEPEQDDFIPTDKQYLDILKLYIDKGLVQYSGEITREENRLCKTLSEGITIWLELTDNFENFLETNEFLEWFAFIQIGGFSLLDIGFYDPFFAPHPSPGALEKFNKLVASDPRDIVEVAMDTRYDELNPRYDARYCHFDDKLADTIGHELEAMGIVDGIRSIINMDVRIYSERLRE